MLFTIRRDRTHAVVGAAPVSLSSRRFGGKPVLYPHIAHVRCPHVCSNRNHSLTG